MAGDGTLFQRKQGSKCYLIINTGEKDEKGKYKQKWIDLETTDKNVAKEKIRILRGEIAKKGRYDEPSKELFGEWLDFWLDQIVKTKIRPTTYDFYEYLIRVHIKPGLGGYKLKHLSPEQLQVFYNQKLAEKKLSKKKDDSGNYIPGNETLSARTVKGIQVVIQMALEKAVAMRKLPENPNNVIDRIEYKRPKVKYLTSSQVADFLEKIRDEHWYAAFVTDLGTGLRISELVALKWQEHVDLERGIIRVQGGRVEVKTHEKNGPRAITILQSPKSEKGFRIVPLPDDVIEVLKTWKVRQDDEKTANKKRYNDQGYVFAWEDGRPLRTDYLSKQFLKLVRAHGYEEGLTFHKLRHSYASMLLEMGEEMKTIQENLGDSTLQIVSDTYTHVADELKARAAKRLNGFTQRKAWQN